MLLAEDLLLLVTDDATGKLSVPGAQADAGLGGANLLELTLRNKVDVSGEQDPGRAGRIIVRDPSPVGDEVLDTALQVLIARQGSKPSAVIKPLARNIRPVLYQRLAAGGVLRPAQGRALGIFPTRSWPPGCPLSPGTSIAGASRSWPGRAGSGSTTRSGRSASSSWW